MNVPLIRIIPDNLFLLDSIAWTPYPIPCANNRTEIIDAIKKSIEWKESRKKVLQAIGKKYKNNYFSRYNKDIIKAFD